MQSNSMRELLDSTFEELALLLGGAFAVHRFSEDAVWQIMKGLETAHAKATAKLQGLGPTEGRKPEGDPFQPHPTVEALLLKLRKRKAPAPEQP
jgi:hypothetical protein